MINIGDVLAGSVVQVPWSTNGADGASITRATDGSIRVYKDNSATQRVSAAGITDTEDFDSLTGVHLVNIDTSDNTDAGFYASGHNYHVMLVAATIDGKTVNSWLATFSIQNRFAAGGTINANVTQWNGTNVASPHTAGYPVVTIKDGTGTGELDTASGAVAAVASVVSVGTGAITSASFAAGAITAASLAADAITAAKVAADVGTEIAAAVWDRLTSALTTVGSIGKLLVDRIDAAISSVAGGSAPSASDIADEVETRDLKVGTLNAGTVTASALATDAVNEIADGVMVRASSNWEGAAPAKSLGGAVMKLTHKVDSAAGTLTVKKSDDSTTAYTQTETTDAAAAPLIGLSGAS